MDQPDQATAAVVGPGPTRGYLATAWAMPPAVLTQIGLAFFGVPLIVHGVFGIIVGSLAALLLRRVLSSASSHSQRVLSIVLVGLLGVQPCLVAAAAVSSVSFTLHAINAFVILAVALALALDAEDGPPSGHVS